MNRPWSSDNLTGFPRAAALRKTMQSLALLDAIVCPDWEGRYFSFNSRWDEGEQMGSMRDGEGNSLFALFADGGVVLGGSDHESRASGWNFDALEFETPLLQRFVREPAVTAQELSFLLFQQGDADWIVLHPETRSRDGSEWMLAFYDGKPSTYHQWAEEYYEEMLELEAVEHIFAFEPLDESIVQQLNADLTLEQVRDDLQEIGYPSN